MEMKEYKHTYTEGVSYEDLYEDQKQLKKETEHIEGLSLEAHEEHDEDQIKLKKETDETGSIEILEIKESKDKYFESVSVEAQEETMDNEVKIDLPKMLTPEVLTPEVQMSEVLTPEVLLPEVLTPKVLTTEVLMSEVLTPEVLPPEVLLPEVLTPEVLTPEGLMAEVLTSNVLMPEGLTPEGLMTEILTPEVLTPEVLTPAGLMSTVLPTMPQLCNVYAKQVVTELPSTSNFEITINNEDINLEAVDLTQPKELIELEEKPKEDIEMVDQIQTPDLTELKESEEVEGVTLDIQKELYNLETVDLTPEDLIELEVEPKEIQGVSLDIQKELYNLNTVDLTPEEMIEFKVEPKEVEGVSLDVQGKLYNLDTVNLTPGEMLEWKVEPKKLEAVTLDVKKELYNLEAVGFTPEDLIKLEVEPKEVEGVSLDIQKELYNLETVKVEGVSLDIQKELYNLETVKVEGVSLDIEKELYNLDTVDLTPEDLIELEVEPKEVEGVSLDVQGELYNLETIDLMAEELKVEAKDLEGLYVDHEVIDEVVLGPVVLTRPDVMYTRQEVPIETEASWEIPIHYEMKEEPKHYIDVVNFHAQAGYVDDVQNGLLCPEMLQAVDTKQFEGARRSCSVMLERILVDRNRRTCRVGHETYRLRGVVPRWKKGFKFNLSKARLAIQDKLNNINKRTSPQTPPPLKKVLVAGPQSKKSANDKSDHPLATSNASFHRIQPDLPSKKVLFVPPTLSYLPHSNQAPNLPSKNIIVLSYSTKTSRPVKRRYNFKCYFCTETFKTKVSLVEHKSKVHRIKMFNHELDKKKTLKRVKTKSSENVPRAPSPQGDNSQITLDEYLSK